MNRIYLLVPVVLLAVFGGIYWRHASTAETEAAAKAALVAAAKAEADGKQAEAERRARADAEKRAAERLAEEKRTEAEKQARFEEDGRRIADDTAVYSAKVAALKAETSALEKQLGDLRARRAALNDSAYALARSVELARIEKRNVEIEIARLTEMVARQAGTTLAK